MSERRTRTSARSEKTGYPALRAFCRAYLHQDVLDEHGSAARAAEAFRGESTAAEQRALVSDWRRFESDTRGLSMPDLAERFARLGAVWAPETPSDVRALGAAIQGGSARP